jgi:hypothetical protein
VCDSSSNTWTNCGSRNNTDDSSGSGGIRTWKWEEEGMGDMGDGVRPATAVQAECVVVGRR